MRGITRIVLTAALAVGAAAAAAALAACGGQAELDDTRWRLTEWSVSSLAPGDFTITADFTDGQVGGTSAVNQYGGPYKADDDGNFSVGALMSTEMAGPEPAMRAEAAYVKLLQQARKYRLEGDQLTLMNESGAELLVFASRD